MIMKRIIKTILFAVLIFHVQSIFAQDDVLKTTSTEQSAQKIRVEGIVCDTETGERLPYATIKVENGSRGTITNHEGEFVLQANSNDVLCVHFVGYDEFSIRASEMPKTIQLNPCQNVLSEVTIFVGNYMLLKTNKLLSKQFKKHEMESSQYFFRLNTTYQTLDVTEGFMTALSMGNLRSVSIVKGYHARKKTKGEDSFRISDMNFHHMLELGPWMNGTEFWARITSPMKPALNDAYLQKHYDLTATKLKDNQGKFYYLIHIDRRTRKTYPDGIVTGKLYIDAETLLPLRFDGQVEDINLVSGGFLNRQITPLDIHVALNFDNARGYTEVASIACTMTGKDLGLQSKGILFSVNDIDLTDAINNAWSRDSQYDNLINIVDMAGYDHQLWESANIIKRTREEEKVMLRGNENEDENENGNEDGLWTADNDTIDTHLDTNALLYRISGEDLLHDCYILGTYHRAPTNTFDAIYGLREVLDEVDQVCGEVADVIDPSTPDGKSLPKEPAEKSKPQKLSDILTREQLRKVKDVVRKNIGLDFDQPNVKSRLNSLSPASMEKFLVNWNQNKVMEALGIHVDHEAPFDALIMTMAHGKGKKVLGLEQQDSVADTRPDEASVEDEIKSLMRYIDNIEQEKKQTELLLTYYFKEQDAQKIYDLMMEEVAQGTIDSQSFESTNFQRTANWLRQMPEIMRRGSTLFVVGAAHLCSERGVLQGLLKAGYHVVAVKK